MWLYVLYAVFDEFLSLLLKTYRLVPHPQADLFFITVINYFIFYEAVFAKFVAIFS